MQRLVRPSRLFWIVAAFCVGMAAGGYLPQTPLHAVATDSNSTVILATGPLDGLVEAVFVLDTLTGDLKGAVVSKRKPAFHAQYQRNILQDFKLDEGKKPQFLMVTGVADLARAPGGLRPGTGLVYVAEVTTGAVCAYAVPWSPEVHNNDAPVPDGKFVFWGAWKFRTVGVRE